MDFLIIYEHASRELESACYLAVTLRKLGYKVKIINERYLFRTFLCPKVLIAPYLYSDIDVNRFNAFFFKKKVNIVNLQHEQMLNEAAINTGFHNPKGAAKSAYHICWGKNTFNRLFSNGVPKENLYITGNLGMDLNRIELRECLKSKEDISRMYNLDMNKKWHLFISSFVLNDLSQLEIVTLLNKLPTYGAFIEISKKSKESIVSWMEHYARNHQDTIMIYRPHPAEKTKTISFSQPIENFCCISDFSIRQWVAVADSCSTWFSTSIVDCYFAEKNCCILRPVEIPKCFDENILLDGHYISTEEEYENYLKASKSADFPIKIENISNNYGEMGTSLFVNNVADVCVSALKAEPVFIRKISSAFLCLKADILASIFRCFPHFLEKNSQISHFREKVLKSKNDKIMMNSYLSIFSK